jgi:hypothetical protein
VTFAGKPLAEAMVVFHPVEGSVEGDHKPLAYTTDEGRFDMTTYLTGDGAPAGKYEITVELREPRVVGEETIRDGRNLLPPKYSRPDTSGLTCTVAEGENELPPIAIEDR